MFTYLTKLSECECTGLNPQWRNVSTDIEFPVKQGEIVVVKCKRKHINLGGHTFTCDMETTYKETDAEPSCIRISKFLFLLTFRKS